MKTQAELVADMETIADADEHVMAMWKRTNDFSCTPAEKYEAERAYKRAKERYEWLARSAGVWCETCETALFDGRCWCCQCERCGGTSQALVCRHCMFDLAESEDAPIDANQWVMLFSQSDLLKLNLDYALSECSDADYERLGKAVARAKRRDRRRLARATAWFHSYLTTKTKQQEVQS